MVSAMDTENLSKRTRTSLKDIGKRIKSTEKACTKRKMGSPTEDSGKMISTMGKAKRYGRTVLCIRESIRMGRNMI
jgi:hypothetical protein